MSAKEGVPAEDLLRDVRRDMMQRVSDRVRALALGIVAFFWAVISADKEPVATMRHAHPRWLLLAACMAVASLFLDLLQGLANLSALERMTKVGRTNRELAALGDAADEERDEGRKQTLRDVIDHQRARAEFWERFGKLAHYLKIVFCILACLMLLAWVPFAMRTVG